MDNVSEIVMKIADKEFGNYKIRNNEVVPEYCPYCHGGDNGDKYTFAVGRYNGAFQCMRGGCGVKGSIRTLCEKFGVDYSELSDITSFKLPTGSRKKEYVKPSEDALLPLTDEILSYFAKRHISEETLRDFKVASNSAGNIVFPFYRNGELVYVKYRKPKRFDKTRDKSKEWPMPDTLPILFGMDNASTSSPLVITEGEIDALSVYEAGFHNVVSVPMGCNNLNWVDTCWDWLEQFNQIILFGDNDTPGIQMVGNLVRRFGEDRCMVVDKYPDLLNDGEKMGRACKDANEILYSYGPEALKQIVDECEPAPVHGILNLSDVPVIDPMTLPRICTRIPDLDQAIGGFGEGALVVISGKRGEGKSTISGEFLLNAIQEGNAVAAYSGEMSAYSIREWIYSQACERKYMTYKEDTRNGKKYPMVPVDIQSRIGDWLDNKFFLFDNCYNEGEKGTLVDALLRRFTICARRFGCKMFLVD